MATSAWIFSLSPPWSDQSGGGTTVMPNWELSKARDSSSLPIRVASKIATLIGWDEVLVVVLADVLWAFMIFLGLQSTIKEIHFL